MKKRASNNQYVLGLKAGVPVMLGFIPVGIAYAVMARQSGFSVPQTCLMSVTVFAGASQMMAAGMYARGAGMAAIILTTFVLNLRHIIMSLCVSERMEKASLPVRLIMSFGVTDESFAIFTTVKKENCTVKFFLGIVTVTYLSWNLGTFIGAVFSDFLPAFLTAALGVALYAMFTALLVPGVKGNPKLLLLTVLTAILNTLLTRFMDSGWAIIISTLSCAAAGVMFVELKEEKYD